MSRGLAYELIGYLGSALVVTAPGPSCPSFPDANDFSK